ncbi:type II TA system antitoxin MqsA family protein [Pyxidicoccus sp. MSG2]|uniref:type II TA system antitoxin MqsA family protein n=1 Tax=Pyxidicoccus sp. MSG2 TaxID=2996790 RepID=UPI00226E3798|nr:type II TA system antitoxin MqsA family protein [Pyxidicoccus sp. MSG2]MCY1017861.1 type II toxin-antitoxin system MqsA family antitoxin [Pyxidicoccus sp. MSG2]
MKCMQCGGSMTSRQETRRSYGGLERVIMEGVQVRHCPDCGEEEISYSNVEKLHTALTLQLAWKEAGLTPREIRFLRTYLGLSGSDLARRMGVTKETVSRWECVDKPLSMGPMAERLLRLMAVREQPVTEYPLERLEHVATTEATPLRVRLKPRKQDWTVELST